jgi:hypothetical protein
MPLLQENIKLYKSQLLTDDDFAGGRMTQNEILPGAVNNLFPDISRLDRTTGRINLRKIYCANTATDNSPYFGSHLVIKKAPSDPNVGVLLFDTKSTTDTRIDAKNFVQSHLLKGQELPYLIFQKQLAGSKQIVTVVEGYAAFQSLVEGVGIVTKSISGAEFTGLSPFEKYRCTFSAVSKITPGEVLCITQEAAGKTPFDLYVRVAKVEIDKRGFIEVQVGTLQTPVTAYRLIAYLTLDKELPFDIEGGEVESASSFISSKSTKLRRAIPDATKRFYSIASVGNLQQGAISLTCDRYSNIAPFSYVERALDRDELAEWRSATIEYPSPQPVTSTTASDVYSGVAYSATGDLNYPRLTCYKLGFSVFPGSLTWTQNGVMFKDNGAGALNKISGTDSVRRELSIDYEKGEIWARHNGSYWAYYLGTANISFFRVGAAQTDYLQKKSLATESETPTIGPVYKGSMVITWIADDEVKTLTDTSAGTLSGAGSGTIDYETGAIRVSPETRTAGRIYTYHWMVQDPLFITSTRTNATIPATGAMNHRLEQTFIVATTVPINAIITRLPASGGAETLFNQVLTPANFSDGQEHIYTITKKGDMPTDGKLVITNVLEGYTNGIPRYKIKLVITFDGTPVSTREAIISISAGTLTETKRLYSYTTPFQVNNTASPIMPGSFYAGTDVAANGFLFDKDGDIFTIQDVGNNAHLPVKIGTIDYTVGMVTIDALNTQPFLELRIKSLTRNDSTTPAPYILPEYHKLINAETFSVNDAEGKAVFSVLSNGVTIDADFSGSHFNQNTSLLTLTGPGGTPPIDGFTVSKVEKIPTEQNEEYTGISTLRLPKSGKVETIKKGDVVVIRDEAGDEINYIADTPDDTSLILSQPLERDYTNATIAAAVVFGDLYAKTSVFFDQQNLNLSAQFKDLVEGSGASASYNIASYPIVLTNKNAITERWALYFTGATTFNIIGESVGTIASNQSITVDCAPLNPATGEPYFTIKAAGFGGGWASTNAIRFNTVAASRPVWLARVILGGESETDTDDFEIELRGDIDA